MENKTFIQVPSDITDEIQLKRFLETCINKIDEAFGNRGNSPFITASDLPSSTDNPAQAAINLLNQDISATYVEAEVQAISTKVDTIIQALRNSNIISV